MKIVALGGAGHIGSCVVRELVKRAPEIELVVADYNLDGAQKLAAELAGRTSTAFVDANQPETLVPVMKESDLVLSTLGPYYKYGVTVVEAAIESKTSLIDVCDDADATIQELALDEEAKKAGIAAVICMGATPGITNLMAKLAADKMERVDEIHTAWGWTALDPKMTGEAIVEHFFHASVEDVTTYRDGKWVKVPAGSEPEELEFVAPVGRLRVAEVGHPEPQTLPRHIKEVKRVCNKGGVWPELFVDISNKLIQLGLGSNRPVNIDGLALPARSLAAKIVISLPDLAPDFVESIINEVLEKYGEFGIEGVVLRTEVRGEREGVPARYVYGCKAPADLITALPAVLVALMFKRGQVKGKGVVAPEGIVDPKIFFEELTRDIAVEEARIEPVSY